MAQPRCPDVVESTTAGARRYERHRPETTLLYRLIQEHVETFREEVREEGGTLPRYVNKALDAYLACGILAHGFARAYCEACHKNLLVAYSCKGRGLCPSCGARRMYDTAARLVDHVLPDVPLRQWVLALPYSIRGLCAVRADVLNAVAKVLVEEVFRWQREQVDPSAKLHGAALLVPQRFGGSLQLSPHLHAVFVDGLYDDELRFERSARPSSLDLEQVAERIAKRVARWLSRHGYTFDESAHDQEPGFAEQSAQASLRYGELGTVDGAGNVTLLKRRPERHDLPKIKAVARGFDLHADVSVTAGDPEGRETLCRYILRPPLVLERLSLTKDGRVAYERKYQSRGATHVVMKPTELLARLSALVFPPRHPMLRYHGAFAANHKLRARIVPSAPPAQETAPPKKPQVPSRIEDSVAAVTPTPAPPADPKPSLRGGLALVNKTLDWATLLKRIYFIDALHCPCGGTLKFIAMISEPKLIAELLGALGLCPTPPARAPPKQRTFNWYDPA